MSNLLCIEIIESRIAGSNDPFEFGVTASDNHGSAMRNGFPSLEDLKNEFPTRLSILEWVAQQDEFSGALTCKGSEVLLDCTTGIDFAGYPEDDSITSIRKEGEAESPSN